MLMIAASLHLGIRCADVCCAGASAKARTRDGMTPSAVVALDCGKRSKAVAEEDDEMRGWMGDLEQEDDE